MTSHAPDPPIASNATTVETAVTAEKRAVIYMHLVPGKHDELMAKLKQFASERGFGVGEVYIESKKSRPSLRRLLADAKMNGFDVVVVGALGALGRTRVGAFATALKLAALRIDVASLGNPWWDPHSRLAAWLAKEIVAKPKRGEPVGTPPLGFCRADDGTLVEDEVEQTMIGRAHELKKQNLSNGYVAAIMNDEGYRTRANTLLTHVWVGRALKITPTFGG